MPKGSILTPEKLAQRQKEIMLIALRLFEEAGFQKTSMREIAEAAGMGKSSLYDYFKTKDEIMVYALERRIMEGTETAKSIITNEADYELCLREIMRNHLAFTEKNKSFLVWMNSESAYLDEEYQKRLQTIRNTYRDVVESVIISGVSAGVFRKTDTALATRLLVNSMLSIAFASQSASDLETALEESVNIFLYGVMNTEVSQ
jgi:AcrR family transcriptional regulator